MSFIGNLIGSVGIYNKVFEIVVTYLGDAIDKNTYGRIISDGLAAKKTLKEIVADFVEATPDATDDDIVLIMNDIEAILLQIVKDMNDKPLIDIILDIKIKDKKLGDIDIPDLDGDPNNNFSVREIVMDLL